MLQRFMRIKCDKCWRFADVPLKMSAQQKRVLLRKSGWKRVGFLDICPMHKEEE